jgi:molybdate transport system substrate-binding protein
LVSSVACGQTSIETTKAQDSIEVKPVTLTVSAASSLKDAMEEIKTAYAKEKPNVTITYNFGASGSLQQQIEQGAEADLFISAASKQMDALKDKGLIIEDTRRNLLGNRLTLVIPKDSSGVSDFKGLTGEKIKKIALGEPKSVPAGQYAEEVLTKLNLLDALKPKVVYGKDVKEVLFWVETGNADAGVVYETDAKASDKVKIADNYWSDGNGSFSLVDIP